LEEKEYSFTGHKALLDKKKVQVEEAIRLLSEQEYKQREYDEKMEQLERQRRERDKKERELLQYKTQLEQIKAEAIEHFYQWARGNKELLLTEEQTQSLTQKILQYKGASDYADMKEEVWKIKSKIGETLQTEKFRLESEAKEKHQMLTEKQIELEEWEQKEEPEPEQPIEVQKNREYLTEMKIPYTRFYQAVDFEERISQEERNRTEEALNRMGILDALIISPEYKEQILSFDQGLCDKYIFGDALKIQESIESVLAVDNAENDILFYQQIAGALDCIGRGVAHHTTVNSDGSYQLGTITGTITKEYQSCFIGAKARMAYKEKRVAALREELERLREMYEEAANAVAKMEARIGSLEEEFVNFISGDDLKTAWQDHENAWQQVIYAREEAERMEEKVAVISNELIALKKKSNEVCTRAYLPVSLKRCLQIKESAEEYQKGLSELEIIYHRWKDSLRRCSDYEEQMLGLDDDMDRIQADLSLLRREQRKNDGLLISIKEQLKLKNYEEIRERLEYCTRRLLALPDEINQLIRRETKTEDELELRKTQQEKAENTLKEMEIEKEKAKSIFMQEYGLGYVHFPEMEAETADKISKKLEKYLEHQMEKKSILDLSGELQAVYHENRAVLVEYQLMMETLYLNEPENRDTAGHGEFRLELKARYAGIAVSFPELMERLLEDLEEKENLLGEKDRELFEDILANTVSKKIRARIRISRNWVSKMNELMESMQTSSGLTLSLKWRNKNAEHEEQMGTKELVELLQKDSEIMRVEEVEKLSRHFRSKIAEARNVLEQGGGERSFYAIMREILDYRKWFEFQLEYQKIGEKRKELTDRVFFTFSGGEKAMAMYVPLFSAVVAKYDSASKDAPRLISLDEAFAGVDDMNIRDMFRLMV
ncbi:MAG: SbcC/MukB-like Walker B domain-containing protein, partial [Lachnospiraceae bacterium]|nr:SbcC/MukB-like Walker B domain-containing protein [Lachnospiraceae bacterium]